MILFKKVKGPFGWMSNMSPHPVMGFPTAEAFFQACRFDPVVDMAIVEEIKSQKSPMAAKMVAKKHAAKMIIKPRSDKDLEVMTFVVGMKLVEHRDLRKALAETGNEVLVEDVSARQNESGLFWGAVVEDGKIVKGENHLGKIWMAVREACKSINVLAR